MNNSIEMTVRAFPVRYRDERTGAVSDGEIVLTKQQLQAAGLVGMDCEALICRIYNRQGYRVMDIGASDKKRVTVDLYSVGGQIVIEGRAPVEFVKEGERDVGE